MLYLHNINTIFYIFWRLIEGSTYFKVRDFRFQAFAYSVDLIDL